MAATIIGSVKSGNGKSYQVKWDPVSKEVYVSYAGWASCGKASSASEKIK